MIFYYIPIKNVKQNGKTFNLEHPNKFHHNIVTYEDFSTAVYIRHIFHEGFLISFDNILITNGNNFTKYRINENGDLCTNSNSSFVTFNKAQELKTVGNTFFCQIDEQIISFPVEDKLEDIIYPFHQKFLNRLHTTHQSELFVFIVDRGIPGKFADFSYQYTHTHFSKKSMKI